MLCSALWFTCDPCQNPTESWQRLEAFLSGWGKLAPGSCVCTANIIYPAWSEAACISAALAACDKWNLVFIIPDSKYCIEDSKSTTTVRAVSMNENCEIKIDGTEQCMLFLIWNKEEWMLIYIQTKTNDSCRNWNTILTVPFLSLGDVSSSLSTWRWRTSPATGNICCLHIPKPWLTKWKGGRATARSLLDNWKQNCRLLCLSLWLKLTTVEIWRSVLTYFLLSQI